MAQVDLHFLVKVFGFVTFLLLYGQVDSVRAQSVRFGAHRDLITEEEEVGQIKNLYLINADSDRPIRLLQNGDVINIANRATSNFNIEARTASGTVGSVQFGYERNSNYRTENVAPFAFCGNSNVNFFVCDILKNGQHTVTATPFLYQSAKGPAGKVLRITFTIVDVPSAQISKPPTRTPARRPTLAPMQSCKLPQFTEPKWEVLSPDYPLETEEPQGLLVGNDLIQFSGYTERFANATNRTYAKDVSVPNSPWRRMEDVPVAWGITHVPTVAVGTKVYLCGGYYGAAAGLHVANCFVYDHAKAPGTGQWARLPSLPHGGSGGGGMIYDRLRNALYYSGGAQRFTLGSVVSTDVTNTYRYSLDNPSAGWLETSPMPFHGNHISYVTHTDANGRERHFFLGGQEEEYECCRNLADNYEFIAATETWVERAPMPMGRGHASASTRPIGCGFVIAGGSINAVHGSARRTRTSDVSYYDLPTNRWTTIGNLPSSIATPLVEIHSNGYMYFSNDRLSHRKIA